MTTFAPGLLSGRPHTCKWPSDHLPTWYVAVDGRPGQGRAPDRPTTLGRIQNMLRQPGVIDGGARILFRRGDTWTRQNVKPHKPGRPINALLIIRASGTRDAPIVLGAYGEGPLPRFEGDGDFTDAGPQRPTLQGVRIEGNRWVQLESLNVANFLNGVLIFSGTLPRSKVTPEAPLRGV